MSQLGTVYATKRRRRNGKSLKPPPKDGVTKSNPSKRHRERLNAELDLLASLLPFEQNILSKLDRLSILRLSVSYLRTKSYFQVVMHKDKEENGLLPHIHAHDGYRTRELGAFEQGLLDGEMFLQALNGFLMILTCEGEVFFATHSIESYLGFHQSDIVHQSVYELVHSEDREELQRQLLWNSFLPADMSSMQLAETLAPDKSLYLERSFTVRFRCLLDNTSGFLRLDIRGRIKILHGQNRKTEEPPLALFAYCTPFGPPSLLEIPHKENMFKSKHKLDLSLVSMDQRGKHILGYSDGELVNMGGYDLVHFDDLAYVASAHQELLKTGASGMIAYRYQKKDGEWQWLQTSSRLVYKNSKPDFVICTHRQLMDEEGHDLLGKRTMDFKVSYLDTGLASTYFTEADQLVVPPSSSPNSLPPPVTPTRPNRRYKTQLRDFLSTCRTKRKIQQQPQQNSPLGQVTSPAPVVDYLPDPAVAVAAAYSNLNPMYATSPYATAADNLYMNPSVHSTNFYPVTENLFHQYRLQGVGGYYTDYHHTSAPASAYVTNGFLSYDGYAISSSKDDKWQDTGKYYSGYSSGYGSPTSTPQHVSLKTPKSSPHVMEVVSCSSDGPSPVSNANAAAAATVPTVTAGHTVNVSTANGNNNSNNNNSNNNNANNGTSITPKVEQLAPQDPYERQTVLMWGTQSSGVPINTINTRLDRSPQNLPISNGLGYSSSSSTNNNNSNNNNSESEHVAKWNGSKTDTKVTTPDSSSYQLQHDDSGLYSAASSHTTSPQRLSSGGSNVGLNAVAELHSTTSHHSQHSTDALLHTSHPHTHHHHALHHNQQHSGSHPHHSHHHHQHHSTTPTAAAAITPHHHPHHTHHHHPPPPSPHHHHPHHAAAAAAAAAAMQHTVVGGSSSANGSEIIISADLQHQQQQQQHQHSQHQERHQLLLNQQQQQQQYQSQQQLSYTSQHSLQQLQPLPGCTGSTPSNSSSPSCTSPASIGGANVNNTTIVSNHPSNNSNNNNATTHQLHQLAIIASPIVITSASVVNGNCGAPIPLAALLPAHPDGATSASSSAAPATSCSGSRSSSSSGRCSGSGNSLLRRIHLQPPPSSPASTTSASGAAAAAATAATTTTAAAIANITAHTALAYAPNTYLISGAATLGDQQPDGSPLLSFSEVTNTLLNQ